MDIHRVRQLMRTKSIYEIPLRVTYYARVSSESDEQLNSLGNQISYYENLIKKNSAWTFVPGYIDEGLSGISTKKRENFNRMISDAAKDQFDLVITKEISRFARNTLDSIRYTRELLGNGVGVFFQNDNINTLDEDSELRLSIMSSIAQDELRKLSSRVKFGHQQAIKSKVVLGNNRIFGYRKENKRLVIDEEQAKMVRELFELYSTDEYSLKQLEKIFWDKGYRNYNGNRIAHSTLSGIIMNPKYKGYYVGNKVKVIDMFTKKQKFLPEDEWVMFKDETGEIVPAIVDETTWEKANAVLKRRSNDVKNRQGICNHANLLTGKMFCTACQKPYYRKDSKDRQGNINNKWICSGKVNNGTDSCLSVPIYEEEIKPVLYEVFKDTQADVEALIAEYVEMYKSLEDDGTLEKQIKEQERIIELGTMKKSKLLEFSVTGQITSSDFISMNKQCEKEISSAMNILDELKKQRMSQDEFRKHMEEVKLTLRRAQEDAGSGMITKEFVNRYIDKIYVTPEGDGVLKLDIRIFTGESTQKYLNKLKNRAGQITTVIPTIGPNHVLSQVCDTQIRTGHTFKKMIDSYKTGSAK